MDTLIKRMGVVSAVVLAAVCCLGVPMDGAAWPHLKFLMDLLRKPVSKRHVTEKETKFFITVLNKGSQDSAVCSAMILAWSDNQESADALREFLKDKRTEKRLIPRSAVSCALGIWEIRRTKKDYYSGLCDGVRAARDPFELMYYANRLWDDFGKRGLEVIFEAALLLEKQYRGGQSSEWVGLPDADVMYLLVMPELFRCLAETESPVLADKVLKLRDWSDTYTPGGFEAVLGWMRPNRPLRKSCFEARKKLEQMLKQHRAIESSRKK